MSDEISFLANTISSVVSTALPVFAAYRVTLMSRGFLDPVYKSKAVWSAILMVTIVITNILGFFPQTNTFLGGALTILPFYAIIIVSFLFVDRTVLVAERSDFFHRDILRWSRARKPLGVVLVASMVVGYAVSGIVTSSSPPLWAAIIVELFVPVTVVVLGYGAAALGVSARRTADRTLKRHILLLGLSLAMFVALVGSFALPMTGSLQVGEDILSIVSVYVLYLSVMSLTPLGKVEKLPAVPVSS